MGSMFNPLAQSGRHTVAYRPRQNRHQRALKPATGWLWLPSQ